MCVGVCVRMRACVRAHARLCVRAGMCGMGGYFDKSHRYWQSEITCTSYSAAGNTR